MVNRLNNYKIYIFLIATLIFSNNLILLYKYFIQTYKINNIKPEINNICYQLQNQLENYTIKFRNKISLTVLNANGEYIADINGFTPRIPASNQKLATSSFILEKLGPNYRLSTKLYIDQSGAFTIIGNGDPDLNKAQLESLIDRLIFKHRQTNSHNIINLSLHQENKNDWWPNDWTRSDKNQTYGAPITRLALLSNSSKPSSIKPIETFEKLIHDEINYRGYKVNIKKQNSKNLFFPKYLSSIYTIKSAPVYALMNLMNSESHNFTSEVLFKIANKNWSNELSLTNYTNWVSYMGLSKNNKFSDASGLSRSNLLTTKGITRLLRRMNYHRYSEYYFSSFSILGVRGTLENIDYPKNLYGKLIAKSGTLNNVKAISGYLERRDDKLYLSIIANNLSNSIDHILSIVNIISKYSNCK